ncbi:hypothetical protein EAH72_18215 [Pseudomonas caspiana]|uniref:Uncharacterized protein n=1 Tax=Pseudomonas mandelii TaxID=75612 RepID=A0A502I8K5_9PSED|nr:hypothetical protein EAH74_20440 [Pseudomonas mandelii]TPG94343.1 hypothetical protein EAH72_18215 [Pseudomonas caspiana]
MERNRVVHWRVAGDCVAGGVETGEVATARRCKGLNTNIQATINNCGSEPARDGGITANLDVECYGLIASRLAPTLKPGVC